MTATLYGRMLLLLLTCFPGFVQARRLNSFVRHFEPLSYEPRPVHRDHVRVRRSLGGSDSQHPHDIVHLRFQGFDRLFHLKLRPDASVFHKDLVVETSTLGRVKPDIGHIYSGTLVGDPSSRVFGGLHNGVFEGSIQSRWGRFYVEGAHKFFARRTPFHSVMYAAEDASMPRAGWCGVRGETARWMQQLAVSARRTQEATSNESHVHGSRTERWTGRRPLAAQGAEEHYFDAEDEQDGGPVAGPVQRRRKSVRTYRVCGLHIAVDHLLYKKYHKEDGDAVRTRERLSTLIAGHVARASEVYRRTSFGSVQDVSFVVHRVQINDTASCSDKKNQFCQENMDAALFLLTTARSANFDEYCLAYSWTYRDFADGVLGLAYLGNSSTSTLGVCEKNKLVPTDQSGHKLGLTRLSLNTGIITFLNYGHHVSQASSEITFCHEIGHNFGSPHDEPDSSPCVPGDKRGGNYIMYPQASNGAHANNYQFSNCSIANISAVMQPMLEGNSKRENCFEADSGPICGNGLREGDEQCDCGYTEAQCKEKCCYVRRNTVNAQGCTLKPGADCSPSAGPCCDNDCNLHPSDVLCHPATDCREEAFCSGHNAFCAPGKPKPNLTACNKGTQMCIDGDCVGSICLKYGMQECYLSGDGYTVDEKCLIACEDQGKCSEACHYPAMKSLCGAKMRPGSSCEDKHGYCDVFQKCRRADEKGLLTRLDEALFASKTYKSVSDYVRLHPYMSALYVLLVVALMALFFHCFSAHTPSSHPLRPHRDFKNKLRYRWKTHHPRRM
ncbi:disintegrin and metalloproteinase domain-containing protein 10-like isoform X2 [Dermacentor albipictus]|uniref:disintegrin and metalloproteinase domain-containing protein 10-like isoform X2 n=1 Tax=Dermacentor albipictus TaxID=60249 RepID=UPI0031FC8267